MPNLSIKNVPADVVERLRARARANHRSLQGELLALACRAAESDGPSAPSDRRPHGHPVRSKTIEQIAAEHKARREHPVEAAPRAVDLVRRDRDAR